ncbi:MAG: hypothetical protein GY851_02450 [bacterium]|nr:hypothetical protein [bacterium]
MLKEIAAQGWGWAGYGLAAWLVFYTRFYVQWAYSEWKGRSAIPVAFWYQSALGSVMLLGWAWITQSPLGALSQSMNLLPYSRNLVHIWREQGRLTRKRSVAIHLVMAAVCFIGIAVVAIVWWREYTENHDATSTETRQAWYWLAVGVLGQGLFACRFVVQWLVTEKHRKSTVPAAFWYLSIVAAILMFLSFLARGGGELLYAAGLVATMLIYARNIWFIHTGRGEKAVGK